MEVYHFKDYRHFIRVRLKSNEHGIGSMSDLARLMKVRVSYLSQVLKGTRNLSHEQAHFLSQALGLSERESSYLDEMINLERATDREYRRRVELRMRWLKESSGDTILPEKNQAIFYSSWIYAGVQLATGIPSLDTPEKIARHLGLSPETVIHALKLLVEIELCTTDGVRYFPTTKKTTADERSPLYGRHKINWRVKALEQLPKAQSGDLFFSGAVRIDQKSYLKIRGQLEKAIAEVHSSIEVAEDEMLFCVNLDCFRF